MQQGIPMDAGSQQRFSDVVRADTTELRYMTTKSEIVEYYQQEYGSGWQRHLVRDITPFAAKSKEASLRKRFQPARVNREERKNAEQYRQLGRTLPPIEVPRKPTGRGVRVEFRGAIWFSAKSYQKHIVEELSENEYQEMIESQSLDILIDAYGIDPDSIDEITINELQITAL